MDALSTENPKTSTELKEILKVLKNTSLLIYEKQKPDIPQQLCPAQIPGLTLCDHPDTRPLTWDKDDYTLECNSAPSCYKQ